MKLAIFRSVLTAVGVALCLANPAHGQRKLGGPELKQAERKCDAARSDPEACAAVGEHYLISYPYRKEEVAKALGSLEKACAGGSARGCLVLAGVYGNGRPDSRIKRDRARGAKYARRACELGNSMACTHAEEWEGSAPTSDTSKVVQAAVELLNAKTRGSLNEKCKASGATHPVSKHVSPSTWRGCKSIFYLGAGVEASIIATPKGNSALEIEIGLHAVVAQEQDKTTVRRMLDEIAEAVADHLRQIVGELSETPGNDMNGATTKYEASDPSTVTMEVPRRKDVTYITITVDPAKTKK